MSTEFVFRLVGMVVFSILGVYFGIFLAQETDQSPEVAAVLMGLVGSLVGLILTPYVTTRPMRAIRRVLLSVSTQTLVSGLAGLVVGLIIAALLTFPLSLLPEPLSKVLPFVGVLLFMGAKEWLIRELAK